MSIFTSLATLLGCHSSNPGPDFENTYPITIDLGSYGLRYNMPGNFSNELGYAAKFETEYSPLIQFDPVKRDAYKQGGWQFMKDLDGGIWAYGKRGNSAQLMLSIFISPIRPDKELSGFVVESYDSFYNAPDGLNTKRRNRYPDESDEELGEMLVHPPKDFRSVVFGGVEYLTWEPKDESAAGMSRYFLRRVDPEYFLGFQFNISVSAGSHKDATHFLKEMDKTVERLMEGIEYFDERPHLDSPL